MDTIQKDNPCLYCRQCNGYFCPCNLYLEFLENKKNNKKWEEIISEGEGYKITEEKVKEIAAREEVEETETKEVI